MKVRLLLSIALMAGSTRCAFAGGLVPLGDVLDLIRTASLVLSGRATFVVRPPPEVVEGITEDFGHLIAIRCLSANRAMGAGTFEFGLSVESVNFAHTDLWQMASGQAYSRVDIPRLQMRIGLPWEINLGASAYRNPTSGVSLQGIEVSRQFLAETTELPSLALSVGMSRVVGVEGLKFNSMNANATLSKQWLGVIPYAGIGYVRSKGEYAATGVLPFEMSAGFSRIFAGVEGRLSALILSGEIGFKQGGSDIGMRAAWRF